MAECESLCCGFEKNAQFVQSAMTANDVRRASLRPAGFSNIQGLLERTDISVCMCVYVSFSTLTHLGNEDGFFCLQKTPDLYLPVERN